MLKVFISQPMNGLSKEEIMKRRANLVNDLAFNLGDVSVIQTVYDDDFSKSKNASVKYLAKAINDLAEADIAVFADGWENARGCRIEHEIASKYGIKVLHGAEVKNNGNKYTYKDIIIDPQDERLRKTNIRCYYANYPLAVLERANAGSNTGTLEVTKNPSDTPFKINDRWYSCIIIKKEPEVEYVPFDLSKQEDRDFLREKWIKNKRVGNELRLSSFSVCDEIWLAYGFKSETLLKDFTFLDGTPVGKVVECDNIN